MPWGGGGQVYASRGATNLVSSLGSIDPPPEAVSWAGGASSWRVRTLARGALKALVAKGGALVFFGLCPAKL